MKFDSYDFAIENGTYHFIIWGTGNNALRVLDYLDDVEKNIDAFKYSVDTFIDTNPEKQGSEFMSSTVYAPDYFDTHDTSKSIVIVAIFNSNQVETLLQERGIKVYITSRELIHDEIFTKFLIAKHNKNIKRNGLFYRNLYRLYLEDKRDEIENETENIPEVYKLSASTCEFGENIIEAERIFHTINGEELEDKKIVNIGIYYHRIYNGGIERVISELCPLYISLGYKVILFTTEIHENDYDIPDVVDRCLLPEIEPLAPYNWLEEFYNYIIEKDIDVMINHAHGDYRSYYLGKLANSMGVKYIVESHTSINAIKSNNRMDYCKKIYSTTNCLVTLSRKDAEVWSEQGIAANYIPNPIHLTAYDKNCKYNKRQILWVGRIDTIEKNVYEIVPVMKKVKASIPDIELKVVGKEDDSKVLHELEKRIRENDLESCIELCGYKTDLESFYKDSTLLFMTSPYEGFPMTIVESKNYGLPVVMYKIDGLELTRDKKGIIEVPQGNSSSMANAIVSIVNDIKLRNRLSDEARKSIEEFAAINIGDLWQRVIEL